jgi:uncharacterized protein (DUF58 family)
VDETSSWRGFLTAVAAMAGLLGLASGTPALVGLAAGWVVLLALAWLLARRNLASLEVRRWLPSSAFEGDLVTVDVAIENHSRRPARFVGAGDHFGAGLADRQSVLEPGPLPALHRRILSYRAFVARQWGVYFVGPLVVGRYDPLGLVFAQREVARIDPFEVYPAAARIEVAALVGGRASVAARDVTAAAAGESLLFRGVREFRPGDDVRRIHWPATARRGTPMVRENERDLQPRLTLFLDLDRRGRAGLGRKSTLEYLVRVGSSLLWTAHRRGDAFSLVAEGERSVAIPAAQGQGHLAAVLHELVVAKQTGRLPLSALVERYRDFAPPGAMAALLIATTEIDLDALAAVLGSLRASAAHPVVVAIDAPAFTQVDRPPVPVATARALRAAFVERLLDLDVPGAVLGPDDTPEERLQHPDFLSLARPAEAGP